MVKRINRLRIFPRYVREDNDAHWQLHPEHGAGQDGHDFPSISMAFLGLTSIDLKISKAGARKFRTPARNNQFRIYGRLPRTSACLRHRIGADALRERALRYTSACVR